MKPSHTPRPAANGRALLIFAAVTLGACGDPFTLAERKPGQWIPPESCVVVPPILLPVAVAHVDEPGAPPDFYKPPPGWIGPEPVWFGGAGDAAPDCPAGSTAWDVDDFILSAPSSACGACSCGWQETTPDPVGYLPALAQGFVYLKPGDPPPWPQCNVIQASGPGVGWNNGHAFGKCSNNMAPPAMVSAAHVGFGNFGYPDVHAVVASVAPDALDPVAPSGHVRRCEGGGPAAPGFDRCIMSAGDVACPAAYAAHRRVVAAHYTDTRACTACQCETATAKRGIQWDLFFSYDCSGQPVGTFTTYTAGQGIDGCTPERIMVNGPSFASIMPSLVMPPDPAVDVPPALVGSVDGTDLYTACCL